MANKRDDRLASLQERHEKLLVELESAKGLQEKHHARRVMVELADVERQISKLQTPAAHKPYVSDHAVVRWLERVRGMDMAAVRREILTPERAHVIETLSPVTVKTAEGIDLVVRDKVVVTVRRRK